MVGSYGYYEQDANTMASWGIDMVKTDYCTKPSNESGQDLYTQFSKALNATGRPMLFYLCNWGEDQVWDWAGDIAQMYRVQMDHLPFWNFPPTASGIHLTQILKYIFNRLKLKGLFMNFHHHHYYY